MDENRDKVGIVLEGGGMRGLYTAGVLDVFLQEGLWPDGVIGVSAGAIHGSNYMAAQLGRSARYNLKYINDKRYMSIRSLIKTGNLFNKKFCYDTLPNKLNIFDYDTYKENAAKIPFYVTCSNLETGMAEHIRCYDFREEMEYLRASASLPLVSEIVQVGGKKLLDGGTCDSIPIKFFRDMGYKKNIVVLTRPAGYEKKPDKTVNVLQRVYSQYPKYVQAARERHDNYNMTLDYINHYEKEGQIIVIRPSKDIKIGRTEKNINKLKYMYKMGRHDAKVQLEKIKEFMA
ncbi:MAG: patatin family protein [Lachnospiraceae bacterium]|nr:patatin family protein [Lachnospiraceae bacterium]